MAMQFSNPAGLARRDFMKGALSLLGLAALGNGRILAAPCGWKPQGKPKVVFGLVSDTHFRYDDVWRGGASSDRYFVAALEYFRSRNVDAVVHCGDMADGGLVKELQLHADAWYRVFPQNRGSDGRKVEKLFVTGNHDMEGWRGDRALARQVAAKKDLSGKVFSLDAVRNWERIWGERYEPVWHKSVRGVDFFGMNWIENRKGEGEARLLQLIDETPRSCAPFFFITHASTGKAFNAAIEKHAGAFGLWGHHHLSATNWNILEMLNSSVAGVQCPACHSRWRADGKWMGGGDRCVSKAPLECKMQGGKWEQGLVASVYDDMLVVERREFSLGGSLGEDWVMPFDRHSGKAASPHPFSRAELKKRIGAPQFRNGAKLDAAFTRSARKDAKDAAARTLLLKIPPADANQSSRVYAYEIAVQGEGKKLLKAVYAAGCNMGIGCAPDGGATSFEIASSALPPGKTLAISVRPLTSLGTAGKAISAEITV